MIPIIFIYTNGNTGKCKVLDYDQCNKHEGELLATGYKLTASINARVYIQHLLDLSKQKDIIESVKGLKNI